MKFKVIREDFSHRGGGIEIDLTPHGFEGEKMTAYQNYLGGGMLGKINNDCTIEEWHTDDDLTKIAQELSKHFHKLTNPTEDEWESLSFGQNQQLPSSAY
tara:strand:+ start:4991 stop:5290 length:300 start_codon:yes stop_codon:yes gene_type:complete